MPLSRQILLSLAALCLLLAVSCGPSFRHVQARFVTEAEILQAEVAANNITGDDIIIADRFLALAKTGKGPEAVNNADLAAAHYRIALARHSLEQSSNALAEAKAALEVAEEQVDRYNNILNRVNTRAGGEDN
jgi:hypothetical protein